MIILPSKLIGSSNLPPASSGGGYTGPLDLVPGAVVGYSQRALSSANRGSALYTIRRDSDNTTQSFSSNATTGNAPVSGITSFIGAGSGFISVWNDQSGNSLDMLQTTAGRQPQWQANLVNSKPGITFVAANSDLLATSGSINLTNPGITIFTVMIPTIATDTNINFQVSGEGWATSSGGMRDYWAVVVPPATVSGEYALTYESDIGAHGPNFTNTTLIGYNDGLVHIWDLALDGSTPPYSGTLYIDNESFADDSGGGDAGFSGLNWPMALGNNDSTRGIGASSYYDGPIIERLVYPSKLSDANRLLIRQNIATYYGIVLH